MMQLAQIKAWLKWTLSDLFYRWVPRRLPVKVDLSTGVNLIGYAHAEMGLGEALRNTALALQDAQIPFLVRRLDVQLLNRQENLSLDLHVREYCAYRINMIGVNPDMLYRIPGWFGYDEWARRYNIGYWFWELANFPEEWRYAEHLVEEVWVNTDFVAKAVAQRFPKVVKIPFAVGFEDPSPRFSRPYFGLPESVFLFLFSYDFNSSTARKNPQAVIDAFRLAFPDRAAPVCLVVKSINGEQNPEALSQLKASLCDDPRIAFVDDYLSTDEMRGLLNTADAYVSLHCSEGLGLGMAESMYLGKPVIATAYSGNMEFMNADNACLVPYELVPVAAGEYPYHRGQLWARADVSAAAAWMVRLVHEPDLRRQMSIQAAADMRQYHSREVMGQAIRARIAEIDRQLAESGPPHVIA